MDETLKKLRTYGKGESELIEKAIEEARKRKQIQMHHEEEARMGLL